jgi:hypothetical protein
LIRSPDGHKPSLEATPVQSAKDRGPESAAKIHTGQQQQAAAMEYIQMESMRQAYLQMYSGSSNSPGMPTSAGVAPPYGFGVDPAMAYRMQLMAAAAAAAGPREFNPQLEHWMAAAAAAAASGGHHRGAGGGAIFPGLDPAGAPLTGPGDAKPVDMSAKRMQAGTPTEHRARSPAGPGAMAAGPREGSLSTTGSSGRSQTPLSGSGSFRHLSDTPGSSQQRGSSSHSSHHRDRDRHGSSANRVLAGTSGREGSGDGHSSASRIPPSSAAFDVPGAGGGAGGDPTPPLLHRRPEDSYDGLSPAAGHRRSLDLMQQQQQQMPRHRSGGSTTPSSGDNRAPTPRSGLFPTGSQ